MAIQILRGSEPSKILKDGQLIYDKDKNNLKIGDGSSYCSELNPVGAYKSAAEEFNIGNIHFHFSNVVGHYKDSTTVEFNTITLENNPSNSSNVYPFATLVEISGTAYQLVTSISYSVTENKVVFHAEGSFVSGHILQLAVMVIYFT